jgi:hypothetical protein
LCRSLNINTLCAEQSIAVISSIQSSESFSSSISFSHRVSTPYVHFARADVRSGDSGPIVCCLLPVCTLLVLEFVVVRVLVS